MTQLPSSAGDASAGAIAWSPSVRRALGLLLFDGFRLQDASDASASIKHPTV